MGKSSKQSGYRHGSRVQSWRSRSTPVGSRRGQCHHHRHQYRIWRKNCRDIGATFITLDVSDEPEWINLMALVEKQCGRLDALVNNAGIAVIANIENTSMAI